MKREKQCTKVFGFTSLRTNPMGRFTSALPTIYRVACGSIKQVRIRGSVRNMDLSNWFIMSSILPLMKPFAVRKISKHGNVSGRQTRLKNLIHHGVICQVTLIINKPNGMPAFAGMTRVLYSVSKTYLLSLKDKYEQSEETHFPFVMPAKAGIPCGFSLSFQVREDARG